VKRLTGIHGGEEQGEFVGGGVAASFSLANLAWRSAEIA
jgi:hypothetical protein